MIRHVRDQVYDDTTGKDEQIGEGLVDWGGEDGQMPLVDMPLVAHGMEEQQLPDGEALERSESSN